ncbi:MAG: hypothetical protein M9894_35560 [Planctomycetes bacterium]|nr:hypothetical protein [Planctomycetota bacterium]
MEREQDDGLIVPVRTGLPDEDAPAAAPRGEEVVGSPVLPVDAPGAPIGTPVGGPVGGSAAGPAPTKVAAAGPRAADGTAGDAAARTWSRWTAAAALGLVLLVLAGFGLAFAQERARVEALFLAELERAPSPQDVLLLESSTPSWLRSDPRVVDAFAAARERLERDRARWAAGRELARLRTAESLEAWRAVCDRAAALDPSWAEPLALRAEATLALARARVGAGGPAPAFDDVAREAERELDRALALEPAREGELLVRRARLLLAAPGDPAARQRAARSAVELAVARAPTGSRARLLALAHQRALRGQWQAALALAEQAVDAAPREADALLLRGEARLRTGRFEAAAADARAVLAAGPRSVDAVALELEARMALRPGPPPAAALDELDRALSFDPAHPRALAARAHLGLRRDRVGQVAAPGAEREAARRAAEAALRLHPELPLARAVLAELAWARGDGASALAAATLAAAAGPHLPDLHVLRGRLRARQGDRGALEDFDAALGLRPADARALTNRAALLLARGQLAAARLAAEEALHVDPNLPEAYLQRALGHLRARPRDRQRAYDDLNQALRRAPGLTEAYLLRAVVLHDVGMHAEALSDVERALSLGAARRADLLLVRGRSLLRLERWGEAEAALAEVERAGQASHRVTEELHLLRERLAGRLDDAALREALATTR